jgi:glycosyltransferase involved in cell wall biosynthesis
VQPLVSVIIPAFNAEEYLAETIQSVLSQTYPQQEIIVVDDGSTDATAEVVRSFGDAVRYVWQANSGGCSSPRNHGARIAQGEYITFFDADDLMVADKMERQVAALQLNSTLGFSLSNYINFEEGVSYEDHFSTCPVLTGLLKAHGSPLILDSAQSTQTLLLENFSIASAPLFRRDAFLLAGGFDESLKACEDFHLIYRIAMQHPIVVIDELGFRRRIHGNNMSANSEKMLLNYVSSRKSLLALETRIIQTQLLRIKVSQYALSLSNYYIGNGAVQPAITYLKESYRVGMLDFTTLYRQAKTLIKIGLSLFKYYAPRKVAPK